MEPETNLLDLTEDLASHIDNLTTSLAPLLSSPLTTHLSTLPILDKAKLHILTAYTLESLLFQALQASGADAKAHPVFAELARLKGYFGKVKAAEAAGEGKGAGKQGPTTVLDKGAAARFIRHGLAGNERYDKERAERVAKEKARAMAVNRKFDDEAESKVQEELGRKRKAEAEAEAEEEKDEEDEEDSSDSSSDEEDSDSDQQEEEQSAAAKDHPITDSGSGSPSDHVSSENADFYGPSSPNPTSNSNTNPTPKNSKKAKPKSKSTKPDPTQPAKYRYRKSKRRGEPLARRPPPKSEKNHEVILPSRSADGARTANDGDGDAPRSRSETFTALLSGTFAEEKKAKKERKEREKERIKKARKT